MSDASPRDSLFALLGEVRVTGTGGIRDDESLIRSGLVDSTGLFRLAVWVEEQVGRPLDLTTFDLAASWDTVRGILEFVARERAR